MPLYEYTCTACGRRLERLQRVHDAPLTECPHCGGELKKLISAPALQFKGSGWYVTDYARGGGRKDGGADSGAGESAAAAKPDAKTATASAEAKPAETKPAAPKS